MSNLQVSTIVAAVFALMLGFNPLQNLHAQEKKDSLPQQGNATIESTPAKDAKAQEEDLLAKEAPRTAETSTPAPAKEKPSWDLKVQPSKTVSISKVYSYVNDSDRIKKTQDQALEFEQKYYSYGAVTKEQIKQKTGEYYTVSWKNEGAPADYILRFDYRQVKSKDQVYSLEIVFPAVKGSQKAVFSVTGDAYQKYGRITGWRVSVVRDGMILAEKKSFAW